MLWAYEEPFISGHHPRITGDVAEIVACDEDVRVVDYNETGWCESTFMVPLSLSSPRRLGAGVLNILVRQTLLEDY